MSSQILVYVSSKIINSLDVFSISSFSRLLENGQVDIPQNNKVGTKRYMAPELLDESIDESLFDCWRRADVYSLGLVFWELARRTESGQGRVQDSILVYLATLGN